MVNSDDTHLGPTLTPNWKLWLERDGDYIFGPGAYAILQSIRDAGTISGGARKLGMSYRYAWGVIRKIEQKVGVKVLHTFKGGTVGGGGARVTEYGLQLMKTFARLSKDFRKAAEAATK